MRDSLDKQRAQKKYPKESWARRAIVYHIYVLSFKDSNGDGKGDLLGIIQKLDYLNDGTENSLGVGALWLSPVYRSPMADFGYDVSDYYGIDPVFGTMKDFERLVAEVHRRGMRLIMDFVPNHTSAEHPWFVESRSSRTNQRRDWYIWKDPNPEAVRRGIPPDAAPPNNWLSVFGGSAWEFDQETSQFYFHSFLKDQPDLNWRNPMVRKEMLEVMEFWLHKGVDGFRADAVVHLMEDPLFRDDPPNPDYVPGKDDPYNALLHTHSQGRKETLEAVGAICEVLGVHKNKFMVSEVYLDIAGMNQFFKACEENVHAPFNLSLMGIAWSAPAYKKFIDEFEASLRAKDWPNYVFGNHDRPRIAARLGEDRARLVALLLLTLRGMPFIYYGDELGMEGMPIPPEAVKDPLERNVPGFNLGRDPSRTPMQWTADPKAGFTTGTPWLPIPASAKTQNVEAERNDPGSIFNLYRNLIHYRNVSPALIRGDYTPVELLAPLSKSVFAFIRECNEERTLVLVNFSDKEQHCALMGHPAITKGKHFPKYTKTVCTTHLDREAGEEIDLDKIRLRPNAGYLLQLYRKLS